MARTVGDEIADGADRLRLAGIPSPERDARWLMAACLGVPRDRLTLHVKDPLSGEAEFFYPHYINERLERRPVSRILGEREFWGRVFKVSDATLDPRPETETLVEIALSQPFSQVLDLGTGSGCILVSLLAERGEATGVGTDISPEAVLVAGENAATAGVANRLILPLSNWYSSIGGRFDLIVSNPPYIAASEMDELAPEVRDYDPRRALTDEGDGFSAYRAIAAGALDHLTPGGRILVEIGPTQGEVVMTLFHDAGLDDVRVHPDLDGRDRVVSGRRGP
ncbi:MAG: peptide chain release factor N(5)-glutamine methyltransferase [Silicimonas sp.]|nr:peptide chain release factor N(5)-glutamine methyltransferase [Silicimonas sp.]